MLEIFQIFIQFFIFLILFSYPFNLNNGKYIFKNYIFSYFDILSVNLIFHFSLFWLISFFNINLTFYFFFILFIPLIIFLLNYKKGIYIFTKLKDQKLLFFFFFITLVLFFYISQHLKLEWDGQAIWIYKAINFFNNGTFEDLKNFNTLFYPHLGGFVWGFFWKNSFLQYEYIGRLIYIFTYSLSIFSIVDILKSPNYFKYILSLIIIFLTFDSYLFGGYQEYLLFSFLIFTSKYLFIFFQQKKINYNLIILLSLIGNLVIWTKNEGMFYYLFVSLVLAINQIKILKNSLFILFIYFVIVTLKIYIFNHYFGSFTFGQSGAFSGILDQLIGFDFKTIIQRLYLITFHFAVASFKYPIWLLIYFAIIFAYLNKKLFKNLSFVNTFFIFNIIFVYIVYFVTKSPLEWHLAVSMDRLIFQTSGFYIILILNIINQKKISSINFK